MKAKSAQMSLRLPVEDLTRLHALARTCSLNPIDLVRMSVAALLAQAEANGGTIQIPLKFQKGA